MEIIDSRTWTGVQSLLDNYVKVKSEDYVVILFTTDSAEPATWVSAALKLRGVPCRRVWMARLRDEGFIERLEAALPHVDELSGRLVILSFERDTMSHSNALAMAISKYKKRHVLRAISACQDLFATALQMPPEEISARNTALLQRFMIARHLHIKTDSGSDLNVTLDSKHRWISNRGIARPGGTVILPAGEVATFPASISGIFVADFAFNVNAISERDSRLSEHPVTVWIEGGRAVKYECADPATLRFLEECFNAHCAHNVGELGFGTNFAVNEAAYMNSHINERRPGVHLGFGQHNQDPGVVGYECSIHLDLIAKGGMVWVDNDTTPLDLESITPSEQAHPDNPRDEDVFSPDADELEIDDCCGVLAGDGLKLFYRPGAL